MRGRFGVLAVALAAVTAPLQAQTPSREASDFDIRDRGRQIQSLLEAAGGSAPNNVEATVEAGPGVFPAPGGRALVYSRSRFGLPKSLSAGSGPLSLPRTGSPRKIAIEFLRGHPEAFPFQPAELSSMQVAHQTRAGVLRVVRLQQTVDGLPVYRGRISVALDASGRVIQISAGDAAPGLSLGPNAQLSALEAAQAAQRRAGSATVESLESAGATADGRLLFRDASTPAVQPTAVDAVVFPASAYEGRRAWRVIAPGPTDTREIVIDAVDGKVLVSVSLSRQFGSARVYRTNPFSPREIADFPTGWIPEGGGVTTGNFVDAFADLNDDGVPDATTSDGLEDGRATADDAGLFDHPAGDGMRYEPVHLAAAVTNAFYFANVAHDYFYELGFQESDGALQTDDSKQGGVAGDPMLVAVDDFNPVSARTSTTPDGISPTLSLPGDFSGPNLIHTAFDGDVVLHEYAHNVIDRLVGGPDDVTCIGGGPQESAIEEAVADYFAGSFFDDPVIAEYLGNRETGVRTSPMNANARTYESLGEPSFQEHSDGEILAATLWEIRTALGAAATDKLVLDALKLLPCIPSFVDMRDALLSAAGDSRRAALWPIFARRGLGASARGDDLGLNHATLADAAFDLPDDLRTGSNRPPRFLGAPGDFAFANEAFIYTARAEDPNGDPITFRLLDGPADAVLNEATGRLTYRGKFTSQRVAIEATDGRGGRTVHVLLIYGGSVLTPGRPIQISGDANSIGVGLIVVDGERDALQVTTRGGSGDVDVEVDGPGESFVSERFGPNETITVPNPAFPRFWFVTVTGFSSYQSVVFMANFVSPTAASIGSEVGPVTGSPSSETFYKISVPPGTPRLRITSSGGSGDANLYLSRERYPTCKVELFSRTECDADASSATRGNLETVEVENPEPGNWFLNLQGEEAFSGVRINLSSTASAIELNAATDAAGFEGFLAAGGIGTLFGSGFTDQTLEAGTLPLPTTLGGVQVFVNSIPAALFFVSPTQINFQTPSGAIFNVDIVVVNGSEISGAVRSEVRPQFPRMFAFVASDGVASPVVTHADGSVVTPENPARPGEILVGYLTGAAVTPQPADGEAAQADPLSLTADTAAVTIGGAEATTLFSGATPGFVGLIQVNFQLPEQLPPGSRLLLVIRFGDDSTVPLSLAVAP